MKDTNTYYRYFCTNSFGYGWGKTPLEAWFNNDHAKLRDKVSDYQLAECHIYELTSTIKPEGEHFPKNWGVQFDSSECYTNLDEVTVRYMWSDRFKNYTKPNVCYYKRSFCVQDQDWRDNPKGFEQA